MSVSGAQETMTHQGIRELGLHEDAEALQALAEAATSKDQFLRRTAVEVIGRHPQGRALRNTVLDALGDPSEYVVRTACEIVGRWELPEAHDLLLPLLANASEETRRSAIRALGSIWTGGDFPLVFRIYTHDAEMNVRKEAAWVLRRRATATSWRTLFDAFSADELPRHRQWACEPATSFGDAGILPLLFRLCSDRDGHVRKAATQAAQTISSRE